MAPLITLLTDFGTTDAYLAAVKGVISSINPSATLVDISHQVAPQDIHGGAFLLGTVYRYFPKDTIHLAVVDPGVGTSRRGLLLASAKAFFVGPDNGIFSYVLLDVYREQKGYGSGSGGRPAFDPADVPLPQGVKAYHLTVPRFWHHPVSSTFHARDIFGPVAAHLSKGVAPEELGEPVDSVTCLSIPQPRRQGDLLEGCILHVDHFGNLITNLRGEDLLGKTVQVRLASHVIEGLRTSYQEGGSQLVALVGSHGWIEIALPNGSAAEHLGVGVGERVQCSLAEP